MSFLIGTELNRNQSSVRGLVHHRWTFCTLLLALVILRPVAADPPISLREFGELLQGLSEPEGYFDSDNFVSNEAAYLKILPAFRRLGIRGGVYLGVGPDQNYSYIAEVQPIIAFLIDIRRQNSLQHLYYKALFQLSRSRVEYLERLFGRSLGVRTGGSTPQRLDELLREIDLLPRDPAFAARVLGETCSVIRSWNLPVSEQDIKTLEYIARAFFEAGPDIKFTSYYRAPRPHHPTYRTLLLETDSMGSQVSYLADEERFRRVKKLHEENRIIPVVGDFSGVHAFRSVGQEMRRRGIRLKCLYTSNVEFYLFRSERWNPYVRNLRSLPLDPQSYIIRAYANQFNAHPAEIPGYYMTTILQSLPLFLANEAGRKYLTYWDIVSRDYITR